MKIWKPIYRYVSRVWWLKYAAVLAAAVVIIGFTDETSLWNHYRNVRRMAELQAEIDRYRRQYESDCRKLRQLERDPKAVERVAREQYFMKAPDEDIYVIKPKQ